jgi:hypothetical protein
VVNLSYGQFIQRTGPADDAFVNQERDAIQAFSNTGGIVVVAAGNNGQNVLRADGARFYPAAYVVELAGEPVAYWAGNATLLICTLPLRPRVCQDLNEEGGSAHARITEYFATPAMTCGSLHFQLLEPGTSAQNSHML